MLDKLRVVLAGLRTDIDGLQAELEGLPTPEDGPPGRDGAAGPQGVPGRDGAAGAAGPAGASGAIGPAGQPGRDGAGGLPGRDGADGSDGASGVHGKAGSAGRDGAVGPRGPAGADGKSVTGVRLKSNKLFVAIDGREEKAGEIKFPRLAPIVAGGGGGGPRVFIDIPTVHVNSTPYVPGESATLIVDATAEQIVIDLDAAAGFGVTRLEIKKRDSSANVVALSGTVDGGTDFSLVPQHETVTVKRDGTEWWIV